jgi:hypothetical protein
MNLAVGSLILAGLALVFGLFVPAASWLAFVFAPLGAVVGILDLRSRSAQGESQNLPAVAVFANAVALLIVLFVGPLPSATPMHEEPPPDTERRIPEIF